MSLTIFIQPKNSTVRIVRWYRDPQVHIDYASGRILKMTGQEFRAKGFEFVRHHFDEYRRVRLHPKLAVKVFEPGEARKAMNNAIAFEIYLDPEGNLIISPKRIRRCSLADLEKIGRHVERVVPLTSTVNAFWQAVDQVVATASAE